MRQWHTDAGRWALLYAGGVAVGALLVGLIPGVPDRAPLFITSLSGAFLAFISMWGDNAPTLSSLPSGKHEALPIPWRLFLLGVGLFALSWIVMSLPW